MSFVDPKFRPSDIQCVVLCCSSLQALHIGALSCNSALTHLSGLTSLHLQSSKIKQRCKHWSVVAQLTGLRDLTAHSPLEVSAWGLWQLTALQQLTSLALVYTRLGNTSNVTEGPVVLEQMSDRLPHSLTSQWAHHHTHYAIINQVCGG